MAGKVGEAFVEIVADYKQFVTKASKELDVLLKRLAAKADFEPMTEASGDAGEDSAQEYSERFETEINRSSSRTRRQRAGEKVGRDFSKSVNDGVDDDRNRRGNIFTRILGGGKDKGKDRSVLSGMFGTIGDVVGGVFGAIGAAGSAAGSVVGTIASLSSGFLTMLAVATVLGPVLYVLVGALISLSGLVFLLPAGLAAAGVAVGVLMIAFSGFGEAISAVASGDMEKFNESLKGLSPSAQKVAKDFKDLWPHLQKVKDAVQEAFFAPLVGDLDKLGEKLLPKITPGLERIAKLFGDMASTLIDKMSSPEGIKFFETTLDTIGDIIENSGPGLEKFFKGLGDFFITSLPYAEDFFKAITDGLGDFGEFLSEEDTKESFKQFLKDALATGKEFWGVITDLIELFRVLFEDTDEGGKTFLQDIREAIKKLTDFFKSKDGKAALEAMITLAKLFGTWMIWAAEHVGSVYRTLKKLKDMAKDAWNWLGKVIETGGGPQIAWALRQISKIPGFANGGLVTSPTFAMVGEAGPEVVVPLNNPKRAQQLMAENGLVDLAAGMGEGGDTQVVVYLGTEQITDILDQRINKGFKAQGKRLTQGVREG